MPAPSRPCRACGMQLIFVQGPKGRAIPLQRVRNVYRVIDGRAQPVELRADPTQLGLLGQAADEEPPTLYVSHFETCPEADRFSRR